MRIHRTWGPCVEGLRAPLRRVATLAEVLQLAANASASGRPVGVYIETKGPSFHDSMGLPLEGKLLSALDAAGYWRSSDIPVVLQSFEEQARTCRRPCMLPPHAWGAARILRACRTAHWWAAQACVHAWQGVTECATARAPQVVQDAKGCEWLHACSRWQG